MASMAPQLFGKVGRNLKDDEQLLKLFWNRAELKKEVDELRNENFRLAERLKQEQAIKLRVQQRQEQLEAMLANSATAASAVTYYQLRVVWNKSQQRLRSIATDLEKAHYDKDYRQHVAGFRRQLYQSLTGLQRELSDITQAGEVLSNDIRQLREQRSRRGGFWNLFSRRRLTTQINVKRAERRAVTKQLDAVNEEIQARSSVEPPEFKGLNIEASRKINLTVIAYAQEFFLHFAEHDVAVKAHEAAMRKVGDVRYGDKRDCRDLAHYAETLLGTFDCDDKLRAQVQQRLQHLTAAVSYRMEKDIIPAADTVDTIAVIKPNGKIRSSISVNVMIDEYWDIFDALLT